MYEFFSRISAFLSEPFATAANTNIALMAALFLGFIGSVAPCQISANIAAITWFGNRHAQEKLSWAETAMYVLGKMTVFSGIGVLFWLFGREMSTLLIPLFSWSRKFLGPLLVLIGLVLMGWIRVPMQTGVRLSLSLERLSERIGGKKGAFLLGIAFSLGFCPTMFVLFFGSLMPLALQSSYGMVLPSVFAAGTAMPFLLFAGLSVAFGLDRIILKRSRRWGNRIQKIAGLFFILIGISDTLTYWTF